MMITVLRRVSRGLTMALLLACAPLVQAASLGKYNADPGSVTVSGISSGGAMAIQMHVAYSGTFKGAAIMAGIPYNCSEGLLAKSLTYCMEAASSALIPIASLVSTTRNWASQGLIDNTANLFNSKVYLFSGTLDQTVRQGVMDAVREYYLNFVNPANIVYNNTTAAGHGWISLLGPTLCQAQQSPFINNCGFDPQQTFLTMLYGNLNPKQTGQLSGQFLSFEQAEFLDDRNPAAHSLDNNAWMYVPAACGRGEQCRVHVAFHGCSMSYNKIGDQFVRMSGLNEWADTNNMIVVYPQNLPSTEPLNGLGCWDWWGYDDPNYAKKSGRQMLMTKRMVDRIVAGYAPVGAPQGLAVTKVTANSVRLGWVAVNGAAGYKVFRNGVEAAQTASASFQDSGLERDTRYTYTVRAIAPNGNAGPESAAVTALTR
jgi:poly(3-hydroxybutyrate) depolymerase